ncbi:MAG: RNA polymerase sigma factor [Faecalibacillus sp.]
MDHWILEVIERNKDFVYRLAFCQMHNKSDSDDIFQDVMLRFIKRKPHFHSLEHEKAWFIKVTMNCCKTYFHSFWLSKTIEYNDNIDYMEINELYIEDILKQIPKKYNVILYLYYYEGYSIKEIASLLKIKEGNAKVLLHRARNALKEKMEENYEKHI